MADEHGKEQIRNEYDVWFERYVGDPLPFGFNWVWATVEFKLLGQAVRGKVDEALNDIFVDHWLIVEFSDGNKTVKVGSHFNNFKKVTDKPGMTWRD